MTSYVLDKTNDTRQGVDKKSRKAKNICVARETQKSQISEIKPTLPTLWRTFTYFMPGPPFHKECFSNLRGVSLLSCIVDTEVPLYSYYLCLWTDGCFYECKDDVIPVNFDVIDFC